MLKPIANIPTVHVSGRGAAETASKERTPLPKGWSMWRSDGRVMPPAGLYRATFIGTAPAIRRSSGWEYPPNGSLVQIADGDAIIPKESNNYTMIIEQLAAETAPPLLSKLTHRIYKAVAPWH